MHPHPSCIQAATPLLLHNVRHCVAPWRWAVHELGTAFKMVLGILFAFVSWIASCFDVSFIMDGVGWATRLQRADALRISAFSRSPKYYWFTSTIS